MRSDAVGFWGGIDGRVGGGVRSMGWRRCSTSCLVADGGLLLTGTVMHRLGLEAMVDETVRLDGRVAGSGSGGCSGMRASQGVAGGVAVSLVASMLVGGCGLVLVVVAAIDEAVLAGGGASCVRRRGRRAGGGVCRSSSGGGAVDCGVVFARSFTFGHVRQLDKAASRSVAGSGEMGYVINPAGVVCTASTGARMSAVPSLRSRRR